MPANAVTILYIDPAPIRLRFNNTNLQNWWGVTQAVLATFPEQVAAEPQTSFPNSRQRAFLNTRFRNGWYSSTVDRVLLTASNAS
jgi:hypothetical protein